MDGNIKLSATVISCMGKDSEKDDFYFNGNFSNCHNTESIQCSFEKSSNNYIFAISDSIGLENGETNGISAIKEIKKYHESAKTQQFSLESISEKIYDAVQLSSNLVYSKSIIANQNSSILTGFSSVIIDNNRASVMNLGNNGVFLYRHGEQKEVFSRNDSRKNQKLRMLGISPTTPDIYNDTEKILKLAEEESKTKIKVSPSFELEEGDILLLCSDGLLDAVTKSRIEAVVDSGFDPSKMSSILFQEALKSGADDGITIMIIRVEEIKNITYASRGRTLNNVTYDNEQTDEEKNPKKESNIVNYILGFICIIVISGVLFMGYLILQNSNLFGSDRSETDISQSSSSTDTQSSISTVSENTTEDSENSDSTDQEVTGTDSDNPNSQVVAGPSKQESKDIDETDSDSNKSNEYDIHKVKSGDTLSSISLKYYGDLNKYDVIIKYNNLKSENLFVDQELKIPKLDK